MINAKTTAQSLRVKIIRSLGKCDDQVALLKEIEQLMSGIEQPNSNHEEELCDVQTELIALFDKVKGWNEEHNTTCFNFDLISRVKAKTRKMLELFWKKMLRMKRR